MRIQTRNEEARRAAFLKHRAMNAELLAFGNRGALASRGAYAAQELCRCQGSSGILRQILLCGQTVLLTQVFVERWLDSRATDLTGYGTHGFFLSTLKQERPVRASEET